MFSMYDIALRILSSLTAWPPHTLSISTISFGDVARDRLRSSRSTMPQSLDTRCDYGSKRLASIKRPTIRACGSEHCLLGYGERYQNVDG